MKANIKLIKMRLILEANKLGINMKINLREKLKSKQIMIIIIIDKIRQKFIKVEDLKNKLINEIIFNI